MLSRTLRPHLNLYESDFDDQEATGLAGLGAEKLAANAPISRLDLTACDITDEGAEALFGALRTNTMLKELVLTENRITHKALKTLVKVLTDHNNTLEVLDLSRCEIGDEGSRLLAGVLLFNRSLRCLDLSDANIRDDGATALSHALRCNTSLVSLGLVGNHFNSFTLADLDRAPEA